MRTQDYRIHLIGGRTLHVREECDGPVQTFLHHRFWRCKPDDILEVGTPKPVGLLSLQEISCTSQPGSQWKIDSPVHTIKKEVI